jgi:hypothetical protein
VIAAVVTGLVVLFLHWVKGVVWDAPRDIDRLSALQVIEHPSSTTAVFVPAEVTAPASGEVPLRRDAGAEPRGLMALFGLDDHPSIPPADPIPGVRHRGPDGRRSLSDILDD